VPARQNSSTRSREGAVNPMCSLRVTGASSVACASENSGQSVYSSPDAARSDTRIVTWSNTRPRLS
jgi:hypothetical protein